MLPAANNVTRPFMDEDQCSGYKLSVMPTAFWRFSLRRLGEFPFYEWTDEEELCERTRNALRKDARIGLWLDRMAGRAPGHFAGLAEAPSSASVRRGIAYASDVLMSSVIRHDTGVRGGIAPVVMFSPGMGDFTPDSVTLSLTAQCSIIQLRNPYDFTAALDARNTPNDLVIPVLMDVSPLSISPTMAQSLADTANETLCCDEIMKQWKPKNSEAIRFFALDFIRTQNGWKILEWHVPGRGLGVHCLGTLGAGFVSGGGVLQMLSEIRKRIRDRFGNGNLIPDVPLPSTTFHAMDEALFEVLSCDAKEADRRVYVQTEVEGNEEEPYDIRTRLQSSRTLRTLICAGDKSLTNFLGEVRAELGEWAVLKQHRNLPWWHPRRARPQFVMLSSPRAVRQARRMLEKGPIQFEELVTSSIDRFGHSGELRLYAMAIPSNKTWLESQSL